MRILLLALGSPTVRISGSQALMTPYLAHPDCTLGENLAKHWRARGHEVCNWPDDRYDGVRIAEYFDAAFLYHLIHGPAWDAIAPDWPYSKKPAMCWVHGIGSEGAGKPTDSILRRFAYLPATHPVVLQDMLMLSPHGHTFVLPWPSFSSWEWPPSQPNPYASEKPIVFFCGTLRRHTVDLLGALGRELTECEIHVVSCNIYDRATRGEISGNAEGLFMVDDLPRDCTYHSPMAHGSFSNFFWYADVGLDVAASIGQRVANTKVMDYLAAGLPIVASGFAPGMEIAEHLGRIKIGEFGNARQTAKLIRETLSVGRQEPLRQFSRNYIRAHHSSNSVAETLAGLFENH